MNRMANTVVKNIQLMEREEEDKRLKHEAEKHR
jgi:hypothetical protein